MENRSKRIFALVSEAMRRDVIEPELGKSTRQILEARPPQPSEKHDIRMSKRVLGRGSPRVVSRRVLDFKQQQDRDREFMSWLSCHRSVCRWLHSFWP